MCPLRAFALSLAAREDPAGALSRSGDRPDHTPRRLAGSLSVGFRSLHRARPGSKVQPPPPLAPRAPLARPTCSDSSRLYLSRALAPKLSPQIISPLDISHQISPTTSLSFTTWQCLYFCSWSLIILSDFIKTTPGKSLEGQWHLLLFLQAGGDKKGVSRSGVYWGFVLHSLVLVYLSSFCYGPASGRGSEKIARNRKIGPGTCRLPNPLAGEVWCRWTGFPGCPPRFGWLLRPAAAAPFSRPGQLS